MTYSEAKQKALEIDDKVDSVSDVGDAWSFYWSKEPKDTTNPGLLIVKSSGEYTTITERIQQGKDIGVGRVLDFETGEPKTRKKKTVK